MTTNVLVAHASKHGSTAEIAAEIAERLRERGIDGVRELPVSDVTEIEGYDAVVLGSAVYRGSWMKEAVGFARRHANARYDVPVWLFSSGPFGDVEREALTPKHTQELETLLRPRAHAIFGGVADRATFGFVERRVLKLVKAPEGDFRNWDEIRAFADGIADALQPTLVETAPSRARPRAPRPG